MNSVEHPYFRIERRPAKYAGGPWRAAATLVRKDTDEPVEHVSAKAASAEAAERQLTAAVEARLAALERPKDWGRDPTIPRLLQRYLQVNDQVYGIVLRAEAATEPEASMLRRDAEAYERAELQAIEEQIAALTESQRRELATPTEEQWARRQDPRVLDILTAKKRLSQFIPNPSPAVQAGYQRLDQALNEEP
jgi:hypothetical protein